MTVWNWDSPQSHEGTKKGTKRDLSHEARLLFVFVFFVPSWFKTFIPRPDRPITLS
jgi:hypothetical protein